jgi:hypothetical protein
MCFGEILAGVSPLAATSIAQKTLRHDYYTVRISWTKLKY